MLNELQIRELLKVKDGRLFHREGQELEFKEQFNFGGLADYFRDFAAFANNRGGLIIFGVQDTPRLPVGLTDSALEQFNKIDAGQISGYLLEIFSTDIKWEQFAFEIDGKHFGIFHIKEAISKPVIARKTEGRDQQIRNGEIYYRYAGRTQNIQYAELSNIIEKRIELNNSYWLDLMSKIAKAGPQNAGILDMERALIEKDDTKILVLDEGLANKIKFIKEGEFDEKRGATTLKLVGDVVPIEKVEVIKKEKENLLKEYPLSAKELATEVKKVLPKAGEKHIWQVIKENDLKNNLDYATPNFRNKKQADEFVNTGKISSSIPIIYKVAAVNFVVNVLKS